MQALIDNLKVQALKQLLPILLYENLQRLYLEAIQDVSLPKHHNPV